MRFVLTWLKKSRHPSYFSGRMKGCGAALLLASAAGANFFDIRSNARTATSVPASPASLGVAVAVDTVTIEEVMKRARPGDAVTIPPGKYQISRLVVMPNTILYAPQGATIIGDMVIRGPKTVIRGFTFAAGTVDISNSQSVTIGDCAFDGGTTAIKLDGASDALIVNNDFHAVTGDVITGSRLDRSTISGITSSIAASASSWTSTMIRRGDGISSSIEPRSCPGFGRKQSVRR